MVSGESWTVADLGGSALDQVSTSSRTGFPSLQRTVTLSPSWALASGLTATADSNVSGRRRTTTNITNETFNLWVGRQIVKDTRRAPGRVLPRRPGPRRLTRLRYGSTCHRTRWFQPPAPYPCIRICTRAGGRPRTGTGTGGRSAQVTGRPRTSADGLPCSCNRAVVAASCYRLCSATNVTSRTPLHPSPQLYNIALIHGHRLR